MDHHTPDTTPRRRGPRRAALAGLAGASALALGTVTAAPAWAHDELISATPESGQILTEIPDAVELEFSGDGLTTGEGITNEIRLTGPEGERWDGETTVDGATMTTEVDDELPAGQYEVRYRAVYSDGHQEEDTYTFAIEDGAAGAASPDADSTEDNTEEPSADESASETTDETTDESTDEATDEATGEATGDAVEGQQAADGEASPEAAESAAEETSTPAWLPVAFGAGALAVVIVAVVLVRRRITQVDRWKRDSGRDSGTDSGDRG
ncbi:copper resistance CopC family protein [Nesterenkonia sp. F]|uniref:copper resistance CopC family protein n=1 Tax=Nesterenkonia sp. F TaxID=795955 RepID=UPI000255CA2F|nr:copper resistance CopC family protein [Nesterenkonia sp. F]